jgi:pteridine reductase
VQRPLANHALYAISKGGLTTLTRALARDLGPAVRVNAIAPGALLWPEVRNRSREARIGKNTPLGSRGGPEDIVEMVRFLAHRATYITGQTVPVDGGRSIAS